MKNSRVVFVAVLGFAVGACAPAGSGFTPEMLVKARALEETSKANGLIVSRTCVGNEAQVHPAFWLQLNADSKKGLAMSEAALCDAEQSGNRIKVIDSRSGKTLAEFSYGSYEVF